MSEVSQNVHHKTESCGTLTSDASTRTLGCVAGTCLCNSDARSHSDTTLRAGESDDEAYFEDANSGSEMDVDEHVSKKSMDEVVT